MVNVSYDGVRRQKTDLKVEPEKPPHPLVTKVRKMLGSMTAKQRQNPEGFLATFYIENKAALVKLSGLDRGMVGEAFNTYKMGHLFSRLMDQEIKAGVKRGIIIPGDEANVQVQAAKLGFSN